MPNVFTERRGTSKKVYFTWLCLKYNHIIDTNMGKFKIHCNICAKHEKSPVTHGIGMQLPTGGTQEAISTWWTIWKPFSIWFFFISNRSSDYKEKPFPQPAVSKKNLNRIYSIYQIKKKSHFSNTLRVTSLQRSLYIISHWLFTKTLQSGNSFQKPEAVTCYSHWPSAYFL